jgi:hypothetical protein
LKEDVACFLWMLIECSGLVSDFSQALIQPPGEMAVAIEIGHGLLYRS